jgi:hypothetical protein
MLVRMPYSTAATPQAMAMSTTVMKFFLPLEF